MASGMGLTLVAAWAAVAVVATRACTADAGATAPADMVAVVGVDGGLELRWTQRASERVRIERSSDGEAPKVIADGITGGRYVDQTAAVNRFYSYRVAGAQGPIADGQGIISRIDRAFVCPPLKKVPPQLLGVDRTETFRNARGEVVGITVAAPRDRPEVRGLSPCTGDAGCSDLAAINKAIAELAKAGGGRLELAAGRYRLRAAPGTRPYAHLAIVNAHDVVVAGAPRRDGHPTTELIFEELPHGVDPGRVVHGLAISGSERILIKDVILDWWRELAVPGRIVDGDGKTQRFELRDGPIDVPDPRHPPELSNINLYNFAGRTFALRPHNRLGFAAGALKFNERFASDHGYFYVVPGKFFPPGSDAVALLRSGVAVRVGDGSHDLVFEGVEIYGGSSGFAIGPNGHGFRLSNVRITRRPDAVLQSGERLRLTSIRGDSSFRAIEGDTIVESSEIAFLDDDAANLNGSMVQGGEDTRVISEYEIEFHFVGYDPFAHPWQAGDTLALFDPATLALIGSRAHLVSARTKAFDRTRNQYTYHFTLAAPVPELLSYRQRPLAALPFLAEPRYASGGSIFRNNCIHDTAAGRIVVGGPNTLIEDNVFANVGDKAIELSAAPVAWREGPGAGGAVVRRNRIAGAGYWNDDVDHTGYKMARVTGWVGGSAIVVMALDQTGFVALGAPNRDIEITDNLIVNSRGVGIVAGGVSGLTVTGNIVVDAAKKGFLPDFQAAYCGAKSHGMRRDGGGQPYCPARHAAQGGIMITHARNVRASGNVMLGSSEPVFIDPATVHLSAKSTTNTVKP